MGESAEGRLSGGREGGLGELPNSAGLWRRCCARLAWIHRASITLILVFGRNWTASRMSPTDRKRPADGQRVLAAAREALQWHIAEA